MKKTKKNVYSEVEIDGAPCIEFITGGKYQENILVDKKAWDEYLHSYHWTAIKDRNGYIRVVTSKNNTALRLHRVIVEHEYLELDYWGNTIDHRNNNTLDNRKVNLRIYNSKLNSTNVLSKYLPDNMHMIFSQRNGKYKVHINVFDEPIYKHFGTREEAQAWRDNEAIPLANARIKEMIMKTRNIEFERGLRDKLNHQEKEEVLAILKKYKIIE